MLTLSWSFSGLFVLFFLHVCFRGALVRLGCGFLVEWRRYLWHTPATHLISSASIHILVLPPYFVYCICYVVELSLSFCLSSSSHLCHHTTTWVPASLPPAFTKLCSQNPLTSPLPLSLWVSHSLHCIHQPEFEQPATCDCLHLQK